MAVPGRVRAWAGGALGTPVTSLVPLSGGATDSMYAVGTASGGRAVLRWPPADEPHARRHVRGEALGCALTRATAGVPTPALLASEPGTAVLGGPANLTTWLPGAVDLDRPGPERVAALARAAVAVHATPVPDLDRLPDFVLWGQPVPSVPAWTRDPGVWRAACELVAGPRPATPYGLIHRDFHPGNLLWRGDELTGVIDWAETARGPADFDVAHCTSNSALLWDHGVGEQFRRAYADAGGRLADDPEEAAYWQVADLVGFLPSPELELRDLLRTRTDLTPPVLRERLDDLLARTLGPLG